ncbi:OmpA family protein [Agitococcus lubricus]|uniref:OmpA family protein n=1 Tax=Agitococcus lubricus TaxID=1077255 RepID=A0A2T5IZ26_9GAMM|nr:OmpA family protein [Agitococcus lubricus]PTQ89250.1 OmpA family protein [Agitococcus lubricus]
MRMFVALTLCLACQSLLADAITIVNHQLQLSSMPQFIAHTAELTPESRDSLLAIKSFLEQKTYITTLRIEGHVVLTNEAENLALSQARALAIGQGLVAVGVDCQRLVAVGFGSTKPIALNSTPEGRAENNRIVFAVAALRNRAIGGMPLEGLGVNAGELCAVADTKTNN